MKIDKALILGQGYTGSALKRLILKESPQTEVVASNRKAGDIKFDFEKPKTWENLPWHSHCFITFPLTNTSLLKEFLETKEPNNLILIGTTSSFVVDESGEMVTEKTPIAFDHPRTACENMILDYGGHILYAAGIYGPKRNPAEWVRSSRVGPNEKLVNWIQVEDLAGLMLKLAESDHAPQRWIANDNKPLSWNEICEHLDSTYKIKSEIQSYQSKRSSKRIQNSSLENLGYELKYPSLYHWLKHEFSEL